MKKAASIPNYAALIEATYVALKQLGGSGRNDEINKAVYSILNISDEVLDILHTGRTSFSEIDYRLAWARTLLKNYGAITNSARRVWTISSEFADIDAVDGAMVEKCRNISNHTAEKGAAEVLEPDSMDSDAPQDTETWRQRVFNILIHMDP